MSTLQDLAAQLASLRDSRIDSAHKSYEESLLKMDRTFLFIQECSSLGLNLPEITASWRAVSPYYDFDINTDEGKHAFRVVKMVCGDLQEAGMEPYDPDNPSNPDRRKRLVQITAVPKNKDYAHISFRYIKRLPKEARCRLIKEVTKHTRLVCENPIGE